MEKTRLSVGLTAVAGTVMLLLTVAAQAQTNSYSVLIDSDRSAVTGCSFTPPGTPAIAGSERLLTATLDTASTQIIDVTLQRCVGGAFDTPTSLIALGYPLGLNNGTTGGDVIELDVPLSTLDPGDTALLRLVYVASDSTGSDVIATTTGQAGAGDILLGLPVSIPALSLFGLVVLAALVLVLAWRRRRLGGGVSSLYLLLFAGVVMAINFISDGDVSDWAGASPRATDLVGDASNGNTGIDLLAGFAALENNRLFFRMDVVDAENQAPVALNDSFAVDEDNALTVTAPGVLSNDSDPDLDPITAVIATGPANAQSFTLNADGSFNYTPVANFNGTDTFTYVADDGVSQSAPATVTLTVNPINDPPVALNDSATTLEDNPVTIDVLANDTDIDGNPDPASVNVTVPPVNGGTSVNPATGAITYTKTGDFSGSDGLTYQVCDDGTPLPALCATATVDITVTTVNDAPSFTAGGNVAVNEDAGPVNQPWATAISAGPPDEAGQVLTFNITANDNPALFSAGPAIDPGTGNLSFTPAVDAFGTANITVELMDNGGTANGGVDTSPPASFVITVNAVNDPPVTVDDVASTAEDTALAIIASTLAGNDSPGPPNEAAQTLTVTAVSAASAQGGTVVLSLGTVSYTPPADFSGADSFTYTVTDDGTPALAASGTVNITVSAVNDPPVAAGDAVGVSEDTPAMIAAATLIANDSPGPGEGGQTLTVTAVDAVSAQGGTLSLAGGIISYTPPAEFSGADSFGYTVTDDGTTNGAPDPQSASATVTLTVAEVNDLPIAANDAFATNEDTALMITGASLTANDSAGPANESGQTLTVTAVDPASAQGGALSLSGGDVTYTPASNFNGTDSFSYTVTDNGTTNGAPDPQSDTATVTITVNPVNDPPVVVSPGPFAAVGNVRIQVPTGADDLLTGASDPADGAGALPLTVTAGAIASANGGSVTVNANGSFNYNPPPGFEGADSFQFQVCDSGVPGSACAMATVTVNVNGMLWFIDPAAAGGGDGRLTAPFNDIDVFNAVNDGTGNRPAAGDSVFLFSGSHTGSVTLLANQRVFGQSATDTLAAMTGLTPPVHSDPFPATNIGATTVQTVNATAITLGANNTLRGFVIGNTGTGTGIAGVNLGTLTVSEMSITGSGQALDLSTGTLANGLGASPGFSSITSTSGTRNISLAAIGGTANLGAGALSGASTQAFFVDGGAATLTYTGTINNTTNRVVDIQNKTGGAVNLNGNITGSSQGIFLNNNTGATLSFRGGMTLNTGANPGFTATGGGTVEVCDENPCNAGATGALVNQITSTTGTALNVANTTIGSNNLEFRSISANGSTNGIVLNATGSSGGLKVKGTAAAGSGGTVQNTTGTGILLTNTSNVALSQMTVQNSGDDGIGGAGVNGLALTGLSITGSGNAIGDSGIEITNLTGTGSMANTSVTGSSERNVRIVNTAAGTLSAFNVTGSTFATTDFTTGDDGFLVENNGSGAMSFSITGSTFTDNKGDHLQVVTTSSATGSVNFTFSNNTLTTTAPNDPLVIGGGITISPSGSADITFTMATNNIQQAFDEGVNFNLGTASTAAAVMSGSFTNSTVGTPAVADSGSESGSTLTFTSNGAGATVVSATGNSLHQYANPYGVLLNAKEGSADLDATVTGNTISDPGSFALNGIRVDAGATSGPPADSGILCAEVDVNSAATSGLMVEDIRLRQRFATTIVLPGYLGLNNDTAAVNTFVAGKNAGTAVSSAHNVGGGGNGFVNGACLTP